MVRELFSAGSALPSEDEQRRERKRERRKRRGEERRTGKRNGEGDENDVKKERRRKSECKQNRMRCGGGESRGKEGTVAGEGEREGVTTSVFSLDIRLPHPVSHQWTVALISTIGEKNSVHLSLSLSLSLSLCVLSIFSLSMFHVNTVDSLYSRNVILCQIEKKNEPRGNIMVLFLFEKKKKEKENVL